MRRLALLLALPAALAFGADDAFACSCLEVTLPQELAWSSEIYTGFLVSKEPRTGPGGYPVTLVTLRPHWIWRGTPVQGLFQLVTGTWDGDCGIDFQPDEEWLVFAHPDAAFAPVASAWLCGRTHAIYPGDPDIDGLGPPLVTPARGRTWGAVKALYR